MKKIKFHTSLAGYAGTDDYISLNMKIPTKQGEMRCETGYLETEGEDDRVRGSTDVYKPVAGSFGTCTDDDFSKREYNLLPATNVKLNH